MSEKVQGATTEGPNPKSLKKAVAIRFTAAFILLG